MANKPKSHDIKRLIEESLAKSGVKDSGAIEDLLEVLESEKIFKYSQAETISILSTAGRVMVVLAEDPTMTSRSISQYLNLSETMIEKTLKALAYEGLIIKTKVGRQNVYEITTEKTKNHPDIRHLKIALGPLLGDKESTRQVVDEEPF